MRFFAFYFLALFTATAGINSATNADAQTKVPEVQQDAPGKKEAPEKPAFELAEDLDGLFAQLKRTGKEKRAKRITQRIWSLWQESDSRSIDLMTYWARSAQEKQQYGAALDLLDQLVVIRPAYAEGWNQRATLHFVMKNYAKSIADIEKTLSLEPRHFGALGGLATIQETLGRDKDALVTWYEALDVYPAMKSAQSAVIRLEEKLAGESL